MARNKYIRDYRLVEHVSERGRIRTDYEYIGAYYRFVQTPATVRREKRILLALCAVGWIAFVCALLPNSLAMRTIYVSLPFAFGALPMGILTDIGISAFAAKEPLEHRQADKLSNRYPPAALAVAVLAAAAIAGETINLLRGQALCVGDICFSLCAGVLLACGIIVFSRRGNFATCKGDR